MHRTIFGSGTAMIKPPAGEKSWQICKDCEQISRISACSGLSLELSGGLLIGLGLMLKLNFGWWFNYSNSQVINVSFMFFFPQNHFFVVNWLENCPLCPEWYSLFFTNCKVNCVYSAILRLPQKKQYSQCSELVLEFCHLYRGEYLVHSWIPTIFNHSFIHLQ